MLWMIYIFCICNYLNSQYMYIMFEYKINIEPYVNIYILLNPGQSIEMWVRDPHQHESTLIIKEHPAFHIYILCLMWRHLLYMRCMSRNGCAAGNPNLHQTQHNYYNNHSPVCWLLGELVYECWIFLLRSPVRLMFGCWWGGG